MLAPSVKSEKKVRSILEGLCDSTNRQVNELGHFMAYMRGEEQPEMDRNFEMNYYDF